MLYFKNSEIVKAYHVSLRTVLNWIREAQQDKLDLALYSQSGKVYIAKNSTNIKRIEQLVEARKKYRNTRGLKQVIPTHDFYEVFNKYEIIDIITNLEVYREIPRQYNYFGKGADNWDRYANRLHQEGIPNMMNNPLWLLEHNMGYIDGLLSRYDRVNVVDMGVGNALPVRDILAHFLDKRILGRYIAVDISERMLEIAKSNINKWFNHKIVFEGFRRDLNYDRFNQPLAQEHIRKSAGKTINMGLILGGTLGNLRSMDAALRVIHDSLGHNDLLMSTLKLDTPVSRRFFDFYFEPGNSKLALAPNHRFVLDLLGFKDSFYDVEMGFDDARKERYIRICLTVAITIKFEFEEGERRISLNKGDSILLWRYWQQSASEVVDQLERNGFSPLQTSRTEDGEYMLTISQIKTGQ